MKTKFIVIAVSSNTNSFGLKSILVLSPQGEGWELLKSPYSGDTLPKAGDALPFHPQDAYKHSCECPRQLPSVDGKTASKLIKTIQKRITLR